VQGECFDTESGTSSDGSDIGHFTYPAKRGSFDIARISGFVYARPVNGYVGTTSVITRFAMLQFAPLFPLESFFFARRGNLSSDLISLIFGADATTPLAIPLARIDKLSVAMAYFRGVCGTLVLVGCISLIPAIMHLSGERLDHFAIVMTQALVSCLIVGAAFGALSYCLPWQMGGRQKSIRRACGGVLGMDADPAMFRRDVAEEIETFLGDQIAGDKLRGAEKLGGADDVSDMRLQLVAVRLQIALGGPRQSLEQRSDELLENIRCAAA